MRLLVVGVVAIFMTLGIVIAQAKPSEKIVLALSGLHCNGCASNVEKALKAVEGVKDVVVSLDENIATVTPASADLKADALVKAVMDAGYGASVAESEPTQASSKKSKDDDCCSTEQEEGKKIHSEKDASCCTTESKKQPRSH